jgi:hypothetical protein
MRLSQNYHSFNSIFNRHCRRIGHVPSACRIYSRLMKEYISQTMTMVVGQGSEQVEISVREVMPVDSPVPGDRHVDVSVVCRHFSARNCGAWISAPDWTRFGRELRALDKSRRGGALLVSQSPADLRLRLYAWDQAGHIAVEGHVGAYHTVAGGMREVTLSFAFELDAGLLGETVRAFEALTIAV